MSVTLAHQAAGEGPPLIILHGLFGSSRNWQTLARRLAERFHVVSVDLRNHGRSPHVPGMSYFELAADVDALLEQLALGPVHLLGHSMGGKTAMRLALDRPDRLRSLSVADIAPVPSGSDHGPLLAALARLDLAGLRSRADADRALQPDIPEVGLRAFLLQNLASSPDGYTWRIDLAAIEAGMEDLLAFPLREGQAPFDGPAHFLRGGASDYVQDRHWPAIEALFPRAVQSTIPQAGHWLHAERPAEFLSAFTGFLDRLPA